MKDANRRKKVMAEESEAREDAGKEKKERKDGKTNH